METSEPEGDGEPEGGADPSVEDELAKLEALQTKGKKKEEPPAKKKKEGKKE